MKVKSVVLFILICIILSACQSTGVDNSSPAAIAATQPNLIVEPNPTNKLVDQQQIAAQILNAAMKKNDSEIALLMDSQNSTAALNALFFQVIWERIKYPIDLDVKPVIQKFLDRDADVNATDPSTKQTLIVASASTVGDFVKPLVLAGADVNRPDAYNGTALVYVSSRRNPDLVRFLLDHGARVNDRNPLLSAMRPFGHSQFTEENIKIVKMLTEAGANVNDKDEQGNTPLAIAAMYNQKELVQYFIAHDAQVNVKNNEGRTPLMEAAAAVEGAESEEAVLEVVKLMLKAGAEPNSAPDRHSN